MLVLSRRVGEAITIGDDIHLTVLSMQGSTVRLGISAPRSVGIFREEIDRRELGRNHQRRNESFVDAATA